MLTTRNTVLGQKLHWTSMLWIAVLGISSTTFVHAASFETPVFTQRRGPQGTELVEPSNEQCSGK